jgi:hypothetical protein
MIKKIKNLFLTASATLMLLVPVMVPAVVHAQDSIANNLCSGVNLDASKLGSTAGSGDTTCTNDPGAGTKVTQIIQLVINIFSLIVGVVSVIMIIIGGLKYITSGGDSGNITGAKNTILYAIIGLVVVALAQVVVKFVLAKATA